MSALHVVFRIADVEYTLPAAQVLEMESFTGVTHVPGAPSWVAGLIQVRGRVMPLVDLRLRFGLSAVQPSLDSRIIVVDLGARSIGLLVDLAREVIKIAPEQIRPAPAAIGSADRGLVSGVVRLDKRLLLLIDPGRIASEETAHAERSVG